MGFAGAGGEQAIVADAMEPARQAVQQEAADELVGAERHHLLTVWRGAAIILVAERDAALAEPEETAVRDGDPVGVARQIGEHGLGTGERRLGIDHPALLAHWRQVAQQRAPVSKRCQLAEEGELTGIVQRQQPGEEQAAEECTQHSHRKEESRAGGYPSLPVQRDAASRHDHVDVRMVGHGRTPGVKHGGDADPGAEMPGIGGDGQHRLRGGLEQQVVEERLVGERDLGDLGGQREHDMEVTDRQQVGLARGEPGPCGGALALGAMPVAAGVVGDPPVPAVGAGLDMPAQRGGAAVLDRRHDLELLQAQMPGMGSPISWPGGTQDIGDLE